MPFVPLAFGLYWKRATVQGALASIVFGLATWIWLEVFAQDAACPPQLAGLVASLVGMLVGSYLPGWVGVKSTVASEPHHRAAHKG